MEKDWEKRFFELAHRASERGIYTQSPFLTEAEQSLLGRLLLPVPVRLESGIGEGERCIAVFGDPEELGYPWESTLRLICIAPKDEKFAVPLTHRDYLGALMNLGMKRELFGDIIVEGLSAYAVVQENAVAYLLEHFDRVGKVAVRVSLCESLPEGVGVKFLEKTVTAASLRADAVVAAVYDLSRSEAAALFEKEKVSVGGALYPDGAKLLREGQRVSVRGYGRFYFDSALGETRKGRCRLAVRLFV